MSVSLLPAIKTPFEIVSSASIEPQSLNPHFFVDSEKELSFQKVSFGLFKVDKCNLYSIARKTSLVAFTIIGVGAVVAAAFLAPPMVFPVLLGLGLTFYKLVPLVLAPLEKKERLYALRQKNLEKIILIETKLNNLSFEELKTTYLKPLKMPCELTVNRKKLTKENYKSFIVPILARHLFWKEAADKAKKACADLKIEYDNVRSILEDHEKDPSLLSKTQKTQLELKLLSLDYRMFDITEADLPLIGLNGTLPSFLKAAYLFHVICHPLDQKEFTDFGKITLKQKYERMLPDLPFANSYMLLKNGTRIDRSFLMQNLDNIRTVESRVFAA